jgi:valyl-tRNA synthetase
MPFITEELWGSRESGRGLLALSEWPTPSFEDAAAAEEMNWVVDFITAVRSVRSEMNVPAGAMVDLSVSGAARATLARLMTHDVLLRRLARASAIAIAAQPLKGAVQIVVGEATVSMPLAGVVDLAAERARLGKELDKVAREIGKIEAKLGNEQFMAKAKEEVVEEQRERLAEAIELRSRTEAALGRLGA